MILDGGLHNRVLDGVRSQPDFAGLSPDAQTRLIVFAEQLAIALVGLPADGVLFSRRRQVCDAVRAGINASTDAEEPQHVLQETICAVYDVVQRSNVGREVG